MIIMRRFLVCVLIGVVLALVVFSVLRDGCPSPGELMGAWERNSAAYRRGEISFEELIERSDRLLECSERLWERHRGKKGGGDEYYPL